VQSGNGSRGASRDRNRVWRTLSASAHTLGPQAMLTACHDFPPGAAATGLVRGLFVWSVGPFFTAHI
jgi:hypothetical protein